MEGRLSFRVPMLVQRDLLVSGGRVGRRRTTPGPSSPDWSVSGGSGCLLDEKLLERCAGAMTVGDISARLAAEHDVEVGRGPISRVSDAVLWRMSPRGARDGWRRSTRHFDAMRVNVRESRAVRPKLAC